MLAVFQAFEIQPKIPDRKKKQITALLFLLGSIFSLLIFCLNPQSGPLSIFLCNKIHIHNK